MDVFGTIIDQISYSGGFSVEGESQGLDHQYASYVANDDPANWCSQFGFLPQGDNGNPGEENDECWGW